jgi:hypothetical protein
MATITTNTIGAAFSSRAQAREAVRALRDIGFSDSQVGVIGSHPEEGDIDTSDSKPGTGAAVGATAGAGLGALWGLGILAGALPAIGPAIAGGTLAVILSSAAAGAATAGVAGALLGMGFTKEEADFYDEEVRAGRTIVTVNAGNRNSEASSILRAHGGYDIANRANRPII